MFNQIQEKIIFSFKDKVIRKKILFIFLILALFRLFAAVPLPMANLDKIEAFFNNSPLLATVSIFSGGGLKSVSIVMLGVMPYITASIIIQLMGLVYPKLKELQQEGEYGAKKVNNYSRLLTIPLAAVQAFGFLHLLNSNELLLNFNNGTLITAIIITVAGSIFLM